MAARKKVGRKVNARLGQIRMDGSVNASLDSKARYAVLAYRQSRRTSVWHFVARAARRDFDERRITMLAVALRPASLSPTSAVTFQ